MSENFKIESFFINEQFDRGGFGSKVQAIIKASNKRIEEVNDYLEESNISDSYTVIETLISGLQILYERDLDLKRIGKGTRRYVYRIDDDHILKLAHNINGLTSNQTEAQSQGFESFFNYIPKVFYSGPDFLYQIQESVNTVNSMSEFSDWLYEIGVPDWLCDPEIFDDFVLFLYNVKGKENNQERLVDKIIDEFEVDKEEAIEMSVELMESPFIRELAKLAFSDNKNYLRIIADISPSNVGFNYEGKPVILDHG